MKREQIEQRIALMLIGKIEGEITDVDAKIEQIYYQTNEILCSLERYFNWFEDYSSGTGLKTLFEGIETMVKWPAYKTEISKAIGAFTKESNTNIVWEYMQKLIDEKYLIEQPKKEFAKNQKWPMYYPNAIKRRTPNIVKEG